MASLRTVFLSTPRGELELLCGPDPPQPSTRSSNLVLLCLHGAQCSASDFQLLLPLTSRAGLPSFALSLRGHGRSWQGSSLTHHIFTGIDDYAEDVATAVAHLQSQFAAAKVVLVGHSFGGGILQYALAKRLGPEANVAGLVLLASAGLSGNGAEIAQNWQATTKQAKAQPSTSATEKTSQPESKGTLSWLTSMLPETKLETGLETAPQVRGKFFSAEADEELVELWIRTSRSRPESLRSSFGLLSRLASAEAVLKALGGVQGGRKVLCVAAGEDPLVPVDIVRSNAQEYWDSGVQPAEAVAYELVEGSSHSLMMDVKREEVASLIVRWIDGGDMEPRPRRDL